MSQIASRNRCGPSMKACPMTTYQNNPIANRVQRRILVTRLSIPNANSRISAMLIVVIPNNW
jgi:hypothetical protein